jgi:hypothetical protein
LEEEELDVSFDTEDDDFLAAIQMRHHGHMVPMTIFPTGCMYTLSASFVFARHASL